MEDNLQPNPNLQMNPHLQTNQFVAFMRRIWPRVTRILNTIFYAIFDFLKNSVRSMINQIRDS